MSTSEGRSTDRPARILVVDDASAVRALLRRHLESAPLSAEVHEAADGASGLRMARESDYDCVLCDVEMPGIDGFAFLRIIRATRTRFELPVVLVTSRDSIAEKVSGFRSGASDFVCKPFEPSELVARVETQVALGRMHKKLLHAADVDGLTEIWNRRKIMDALATELARCHRLRHSVGLLLVDVDNFKLINDQHGHPVGDAVLVELAALLVHDRRAYDVVGRMGGEEFAVILPEVGASDARIVAERIRGLVASSALGGLPAGAVTVSVGVAIAPADPRDRVDTLYGRADEKLYEAKRLGRNRIAGGESPRKAPSGAWPASRATELDAAR